MPAVAQSTATKAICLPLLAVQLVADIEQEVNDVGDEHRQDRREHRQRYHKDTGDEVPLLPYKRDSYDQKKRGNAG